jgi:hypothetical protein
LHPRRFPSYLFRCFLNPSVQQNSNLHPTPAIRTLFPLALILALPDSGEHAISSGVFIVNRRENAIFVGVIDIDVRCKESKSCNVAW